MLVQEREQRLEPTQKIRDSNLAEAGEPPSPTPVRKPTCEEQVLNHPFSPHGGV
jgi:hypothetical protein